MTAYFDAKITELSTLRKLVEDNPENYEVQQKLQTFDETLVGEIDVCTAMPGFPEDLAEQIDNTIAKYSVYSQPYIEAEDGEIQSAPGPNPETLDEHIRLLWCLTEDLHTLFHAVSHRNLIGFSDSPWAPVRALMAKSEERRGKRIMGKL